MKKRLFAGLLLTVLLVLSACRKAPVSAAAMDLDQLRTAMLAADSSLPEMKTVRGNDESGASLFPYLCDFSYDKVTDYFYAYSAAGTAHELAVILLRDAADASDAAAALQAHVAKRVATFRTYSPEQVAQAEKAQVYTAGRAVVMIMCADRSAVETAFRTATAGGER